MSQTQESSKFRPSLALRIGITGARRLNADQLDRIQAQMRDLLGAAKQEMTALAQDARVATFYEHAEGETPVPALRMISPLARGADRLAARAALVLGYELYVSMPFEQAEYEKDFTGREDPIELPLTANEDLAQFRELLQQASARIALDGARELSPGAGNDPLANRSYEFIGRFVVQHCDLLVAVWDGKSGVSRGGTAEIVHYAAAAGTPVFWIHATDSVAPAWLGDLQDLRDPGTPNEPAESRLREHLGRLIPAPPLVRRPRHNWIEGLTSRLFRKQDALPAATFFAEKPRPRRAIWKTYSKLMLWASRVNPPWTAPRRPEEPVPRYWFDRYQPADERAGEYASRYRSSYVLIIFFATLALGFGALALGFALSSGRAFYLARPAAASMSGIELLLLIVILALVAASQRRQWHERSIEYRLLAELFRKQQTLGALGWTLSLGNVQHVADAERQSWVAWLFAAGQRGAPMLEGDLTERAKRESNRQTLIALIDEQLQYHRGRKEMARRAAATFENLGSLVFLCLLACVLLKLATEALDAGYFVVLAIGLLAAVLPGVSAAFVGIRSYAELQLLAEQSHHMIAELENAKARVVRLGLDRALVSQDLAAEALAVATMMLQDLDGWGRLFRGKATETT